MTSGAVMTAGQDTDIVDRLNRSYAGEPQVPDPLLQSLADATLRRTEWKE